MPVPASATTNPDGKNIWVAAGDGDLPRVQELVETHSVDPNAPDPFTYTPMHAAASYGHRDVLDYLISKGGDVNITDDDGDTPLYTVEDLDTARYLVEHGATVARRNTEHISPAEHLAEDFPDIASYLAELAPDFAPRAATATEAASEALTSQLMSRVQDILQRADAEGRDPDEELRAAVGDAMLAGYSLGAEMRAEADTEAEAGGDQGAGAPASDSQS